MKFGLSRRPSAAAVVGAVALGGSLALAAPAGAIQKVGGVGCTTNGVTIYDSGHLSSLACFAGTAGTLSGVNVFYSGGVKGVWNHGWAGYLPGTSPTELIQPYYANGVEYWYQDAHSLTVQVNISS